MSLEDVAARFELRFDFLKVVNLAVEDDRDRAVFTRHRLIATDEIDDGEATHAQPDAWLHRHALIARAAMLEDATHTVEYRRTLLRVARLTRVPEIYKSCYATHVFT